MASHLDSTIHAHHDVLVRTTVTLDADVAMKLREFSHRTRASFKTAINEVLRRGLAAGSTSQRKLPRFVTKPHDGKFQPGIDLGKLNSLVDQLEVEDFLQKELRRK